MMKLVVLVLAAFPTVYSTFTEIPYTTSITYDYVESSELDPSGYIIYGTVEEGKLGGSPQSIGDINQDGLDDIIFSGVFPSEHENGRLYIVFGNTTNQPSIVDSSLTMPLGITITGAANDRLGSSSYASLGVLGDLNNDTLLDLLIGCGNSERAYLIFGRSSGWSDIDLADLDPSVGVVLTGYNENDNTVYHFGNTVDFIGDFNGDSIDDCIISGKFDDSTNQGKAFVVFGHSGEWSNMVLSNLTALELVGYDDKKSFGQHVAYAGDINNDSFSDVIIAADVTANLDVSATGRVYIIFGNVSWTVGVYYMEDFVSGDNFGLIINGVQVSDGLGDVVVHVGDINGDGFDDVGFGSVYYGQVATFGGIFCVFFGNSTGYVPLSLSDFTDDSDVGFCLYGDSMLDLVGVFVSSLGDVDGDTIDDFSVFTSSGIYEIYGMAEGFANASKADLLHSTVYRGLLYTGDDALTVRILDYNGDGQTDFLSSYGGDVNSVTNAGYIHIRADYSTPEPSSSPSVYPSHSPSLGPTLFPSTSPTMYPSVYPSQSPSMSPSSSPTIAPTGAPSSSPSNAPTLLPTSSPSVSPTVYPTHALYLPPSSAPTAVGTSGISTTQSNGGDTSRISHATLGGIVGSVSVALLGLSVLMYKYRIISHGSTSTHPNYSLYQTQSTRNASITMTNTI